MVLGRKGQFFLIILVFMIIILVGLAYYAVESETLTSEPGNTPEKGTSLLSQTQAELRTILEEKPYTGTNVSEYYSSFQRKANRTGFDLDINCNETETTTGAYNYPQYDLDCNLLISWEEANVSSAFTHSYTVPYELRTYSDAELTRETNNFNINDTVYYRITGRNNDIINLTAKYRGSQEYTQNHTLSNHYDNGSFVPDEGGPWQMRITNYNTSEIYNHVIHVQSIGIKIEPEGEGSPWYPRREFLRGQRLRVKITLTDFTGTPVNAGMKVTMIKTPSEGIPPGSTVPGERLIGNYDVEGTAGANGTEGMFITPPMTIHENEEPGNITISVTEYRYGTTNTTTIDLRQQEYGVFTPIRPPKITYNQETGQAFSATCGYDAWFNSVNQTHNNGSIDIPFHTQNSTEMKLVRISNTTWIAQAPNLHAQEIHFIGSKHNPQIE